MKISSQVAACILVKNKRILIASRPLGKDFEGFYEFPGGKINLGEFMIEGLFREVKEELGVCLDLKKIFFLTSFDILQNNKKIRLNFFFSTNWFGKIANKEGQDLKWIQIKEIKNYKILKSNLKLIPFLNFFILPASN